MSDSAGSATAVDESGGQRCGDGMVDPGEACDDGDGIEGNGCNSDCTPSGQQVWFTDLGIEDVRVVYDVAAADAGAYWTGSSAAPADLLVGGIDEDGTLTWLDARGDTGIDDGYRVVVDADSLVVAGVRVGGADAKDAWFLRYTLDGTLDMDVAVDVGEGLADGSIAFAARGPGAWVAAGFRMTADSQDLWVGQLDDSFALFWTDFDAGVAGGTDTVYGVAVAGADSVVAVGEVATAVGESAAWVRAYDPKGVATWTRTFTGDAPGLAAARDVAFTPTGELAIVGLHETTSGGTDAWVAVLTAQGRSLWTRYEDGGAGAVDFARGVAVAENGDLVVGGARSSGADPDAWVARYGPDGQGPYWTWTHAGPAGADDRAYGVALDASGAILVGGVDDAGEGPTGWIARLTP